MNILYNSIYTTVKYFRKYCRKFYHSYNNMTLRLYTFHMISVWYIYTYTKIGNSRQEMKCPGAADIRAYGLDICKNM